MALDTEDAAVAEALVAERLRNTRLLNAFRFVGLSVFFLVLLVVRAMRSDFIGPPLSLYCAWWAAAAVAFWGGWRSDRIATLGGLAVPLIDMPLLFLVLANVVFTLLSNEFSSDATAVATHSAVYCALFILLASLLLERRQVYLTAAIAVGLQVALNRIGEADAVVTIMTVTAIACVALLAANAGRRTVALVASVAGEQLRRERLGRYFSPHVAERLEGQGEALGTGESREVTLLFSDIRGFTQLSETLSGEHVVGMLNEYLERMVERIFAHGGTLDKYMGDGIMAYFGAPVAQADHAERAVRCALSMQDALTDLNHLRARRGEPPLRMGIGIHTGQVVVGDIGAARRREYTAIGDAVNVAARMEELTKVHGAPILVSEETRRRVGDRVVFRSAAPTRVRGKSVPLASFVPEPSEP